MMIRDIGFFSKDMRNNVYVGRDGRYDGRESNVSAFGLELSQYPASPGVSEILHSTVSQNNDLVQWKKHRKGRQSSVYKKTA